MLFQQLCPLYWHMAKQLTRKNTLLSYYVGCRFCKFLLFQRIHYFSANHNNYYTYGLISIPYGVDCMKSLSDFTLVILFTFSFFLAEFQCHVQVPGTQRKSPVARGVKSLSQVNPGTVVSY